MYKPDLALNNLQCLACHKTKPNQSYVREKVIKDYPTLEACHNRESTNT